MDVFSDLFGSGGGDKKSPSSSGGPEANAFKFEIPVDLSSTASSQASGWQGPIQFGSYSSSPIWGSGNSPVSNGGHIGSSLPLWVWPLAIVGAFILAKKGAK